MPKIELDLDEIIEIRVILMRFGAYLKQSPSIYRGFAPYLSNMVAIKELANKVYEIEKRELEFEKEGD